MAVGPIPILRFADKLSQWIANPPEDQPFARAAGEQGRRVCDAISNVPPWVTFVPGASGLSSMALVCQRYWDDEGISPPVIAPPFSGGQCSGQYGLRIFRNTQSGPVEQGSSVFVNGPVTAVTVTFIGNFQYRVEATGSNGTFGQTINVLAGEPPPTAGPLYRTNGLPDDCGDPPPEIRPGPNPSPRNPTIPPDERPVDDPESGPRLPIPPLPTLPGLPSIPWRNPFGDDGGEGVPGDPGDPGTPVDADGIGDGSGLAEAEGTAPPGSEIVGLRLDLRSVLPKFPQYGDGIYRAGAYIRMGTVAGLDQDFGGAQIEDGQFFFAEKSGLTKWRVTANVGISWLVTPFYREVN